LFLLKQGITAADFDNQEKMTAINWPGSAIELARGEMGMPHRGFPKNMQSAILKGKLEPMVGRPGDTLPSEDLAKYKKEMEEEFQVPITEEDVSASLMYQAVFRGYMKGIAKFGPLATYLPTRAFLYGLEVGETIEFEVPGEGLLDAEAKSDYELPLKKVKVQLNRVGPRDDENMRALEWLIDGVSHISTIKDPPERPRKRSVAGPDSMEPLMRAGKVGSLSVKDGQVSGAMKVTLPPGAVSVLPPMAGNVWEIKVKAGQEVKKGDPLFVIEAMKMEFEVISPATGKVTILEDTGAVIEQTTPLAFIQEA